MIVAPYDSIAIDPCVNLKSIDHAAPSRHDDPEETRKEARIYRVFFLASRSRGPCFARPCLRAPTVPARGSLASASLQRTLRLSGCRGGRGPAARRPSPPCIRGGGGRRKRKRGGAKRRRSNIYKKNLTQRGQGRVYELCIDRRRKKKETRSPHTRSQHGHLGGAVVDGHGVPHQAVVFFQLGVLEIQLGGLGRRHFGRERLLEELPGPLQFRAAVPGDTQRVDIQNARCSREKAPRSFFCFFLTASSARINATLPLAARAPASLLSFLKVGCCAECVTHRLRNLSR